MTKSFRRLAIALVGVSTAAGAAEWRPEIGLGLAHTDNLTLVRVDPESATAWHVKPSISVSQDSRRIVADAVLSADAYRYQERGESQAFSQFDGEVALGLVPDRFFFNVGGSRTQVIVNPEVAIPTGTVFVTGNRTDLDEYFAGPSFNVPVGGNAVLSGDLRRTRVRYEDPEATVAHEDYDYDTAVIGVDNYRKGRGFTWAVRYDYDKAMYGGQFLPYEYRTASTELGFWSGEDMRVFAVGGKESPWDEPLDPGLEDSFWEAGFARESETGLNAEFAYGERSFGTSRRGRLGFESDRASTDVSYVEAPTTTSADHYLRGGLLDPGGLDYLFRAGRIERYISKRFDWSLALDLRRTPITFTVFDESREQRTQIDGVPLPDETQKGGSASVGWTPGSRLDVTLSYAKADRLFADSAASELSVATFEVVYRLGARTRLTGTYEQAKEESDSLSLNYRANTISVLVIRQLGRAGTRE